MEEFIGEFKAESGAIIETLQGLVVSYHESSSKEQMAEELFRGIHTLKGTSKMFGFDSIGTVTHQLENILDEHRRTKTTFSETLTQIILSTLDFCLQALERKESERVLKDLLQSINTYQIQSPEQIANTQSTFCVVLTPEKDIFERGVNLMTMLKELNDLGTVNRFEDEGASSFEKQIEQKRLTSNCFDFWLVTGKGVSDVEDVFMFFKSTEFSIMPVNSLNELNAAFERLTESRKRSISENERSLRMAFVSDHCQSSHQQSSADQTPGRTRGTELVRKDTESGNEKQAEVSKLNYINVSLDKLDKMMNLVSEFVTLTGEVKYYASLLGNDGLQGIAERLEKVSTNFRDNAFNMRLVPIQILSVKLQRYVKELSQKLGKKVRFMTEGMDTEIDKSIINQIEAPLMHIIRNAMDHGLELPGERTAKGKSEEGILKLSAFYSGTNVFIHIQDDGAGIDIDKVRTKAIAKGLLKSSDALTQQEAIAMIFQPGFSTAEKTTEISGRGVGMDVVRQNIADLRGSIEVTTEKDLGTSFAIRLPLALSIMDVMIIKVGGLNYMVPNAEIEFCTSEKFTHQVQRKGFNLSYNNKLIPFLQLRSVFDCASGNASDSSILIMTKNDQVMAIEVDEIAGKEQVVIKPIDDTLQIIQYMAGTSVLGNGELAFLIDVLKLKELYAVER